MTKDYKNTQMYKIYLSNETNIDNIYIGHTTGFTGRMYNHKSNCNNPKSKKYNQKTYKFIRENGGWDNFVMRTIENYPCNNKREAEQREEELRIELGAKLNSKRAFATPETNKEQKKLYKQKNAEKIKHQQAIYRKLHAEENKLYQKQYRQRKKLLNTSL